MLLILVGFSLQRLKIPVQYIVELVQNYAIKESVKLTLFIRNTDVVHMFLTFGCNVAGMRPGASTLTHASLVIIE